MSSAAQPVDCRICQHPVEQKEVEKVLLESECIIARNLSDRPDDQKFVMCARCTRALRDGKLSSLYAMRYTSRPMDE